MWSFIDRTDWFSLKDDEYRNIMYDLKNVLKYQIMIYIGSKFLSSSPIKFSNNLLQ